MDVSVVIPAKDEEDTIGACLDCLVAQVTERDEILVLDNGSTDATAAIASRFEQVTVIDAPDERLTGGANFRGLDQLRQFGAEQASNELIATTDADTRPPDGWLDRIRTHFESDSDLVVVWGVVTDTNGVPVRNLTGKYLTFLGGVSGANTAFRASAFDQLEKGYVGWPMFEDVALITRLARTGKAVHDRGLRMQSDLDRRRYQTIPILVASAASLAVGTALGGPVGTIAQGAGLGFAGTELLYERAPETRFHHDQLGLGAVAAGTALGGPVGTAAAAAGSGIVGHHVMTEGVSAVPTALMETTDEVCELPADAGPTDIVCETPDEPTASMTRIAAGVATGAVAGKLLSTMG